MKFCPYSTQTPFRNSSTTRPSRHLPVIWLSSAPIITSSWMVDWFMPRSSRSFFTFNRLISDLISFFTSESPVSSFNSFSRSSNLISSSGTSCLLIVPYIAAIAACEVDAFLAGVLASEADLFGVEGFGGFFSAGFSPGSNSFSLRRYSSIIPV